MDTSNTTVFPACSGYFTTTEFVLFVLIAFLVGVLVTALVIMWLLNLRLVFGSFTKQTLIITKQRFIDKVLVPHHIKFNGTLIWHIFNDYD